MPSKTADQPSARERLLAAADELFYTEGVHTVGIDRVIEHAGVAKATLYSAFGSKDELIRSYLQRRDTARRQLVTRSIERYESPRERVLAVFDALAELFAGRSYRGCAFIRASAEARPGSAVEEACDDYRGWLRSLLIELARAVGAAEPERLARQLVLLYDGANVGAQLDRNADAAIEARAVAEVLLDAAIGR